MYLIYFNVVSLLLYCISIMHNFKSKLSNTKKLIFGQKKYSSQSNLFASLAGYYHGKDAKSFFALRSGMLYVRDLNNGAFRIASVSSNRKLKSFDVGTMYLEECFADRFSTILDNNIIESKIIVNLGCDDDSISKICVFKFHDEKLIQYEMGSCDFESTYRSLCEHKLIDLVKADLDVDENEQLNNDKKFYQVLALC